MRAVEGGCPRWIRQVCRGRESPPLVASAGDSAGAAQRFIRSMDETIRARPSMFSARGVACGRRSVGTLRYRAVTQPGRQRAQFLVEVGVGYPNLSPGLEHAGMATGPELARNGNETLAGQLPCEIHRHLPRPVY